MKGLTMKKLVLTAAVALLALTGCGASNAISPAADSTTPAPATSSAPPQGVAAFGEAVTFPDGLSVKATAAVVPASPQAAGAVEGQIVILTVVATNTSKAAMNASLGTYPKVTYGATGLPASTAFDGDKTNGSIGNLLPGESQTATHGYGIPASGLADIRVEFRGLNYDDTPAVFKGAVK